MGYTDNLYGLSAATPTRVTRRDEYALAFSYPTDVVLPDGTPVKFDANGKLVVAVNSPAIGIISVSKASSQNQTIAEGRATVQMYAMAEVTGKATAAVAPGDELKFAGVDSAGLLTYTKAVAGDIVVAIATTAAPANGFLPKTIVLSSYYKKA